MAGAAIWRMNGSQILGSGTRPCGQRLSIAGVGDFNGDGRSRHPLATPRGAAEWWMDGLGGDGSVGGGGSAR